MKIGEHVQKLVKIGENGEKRMKTGKVCEMIENGWGLEGPRERPLGKIYAMVQHMSQGYQYL